MLLPKKSLAKEEKHLLDLYKGLSEQDRKALVAFAEFLDQRSDGKSSADPVSAEKVAIPRPEEETVVAAIKRLSLSYPMLDRSLLLTETSSLMTAHIMHGREADEVIDDLEVLFERFFQQHKQQDSGKE